MKNLIIHPKDSSTDFLTTIYESLPNKTVITGGKSKQEVIDLINSHDRVIMCGHGCDYGLFSVGQFKNCLLIIDQDVVEALSKKDNSIFIWCNADQFVKKHNLKGFYSGMFISEVPEAVYCGLSNINDDMIDESNYGFCKIVSDNIDKPEIKMYDAVINNYEKIAKNNQVARYNLERLYLSI